MTSSSLLRVGSRLIAAVLNGKTRQTTGEDRSPARTAALKIGNERW